MPGLACRLLLLSSLAVSLAGCDAEQSPEEAVRAVIETAVDAAERRDTSDLLELVDDAYLDRDGQNKKQIAGLLRAYFFTHKNIHLFTRIGKIDWLDERQTKVILHVAMAGSVISNIDALQSLRAQLYRFELGLTRHEDGRWLLQHADWRPVESLDLQ